MIRNLFATLNASRPMRRLLTSGLLLCVLSAVGLILLGAPPDPMDSAEAFFAWSRWPHFQHLIASPALLGLTMMGVAVWVSPIRRLSFLTARSS